MIEVIVDANCASLVFGDLPPPDYVPVGIAIAGKSQTARLCMGGKLVLELQKLALPWKRILELERAGRVRRHSATIVDAEEASVSRLRTRSDDPHILALARCSGCRLLVSQDKALVSDFKDTKIVPTPRGRIYGNAKHQKLLGLDKKRRKTTDRKKTRSR